MLQRSECNNLRRTRQGRRLELAKSHRSDDKEGSFLRNRRRLFQRPRVGSRSGSADGRGPLVWRARYRGVSTRWQRLRRRCRALEALETDVDGEGRQGRAVIVAQTSPPTRHWRFKRNESAAEPCQSCFTYGIAHRRARKQIEAGIEAVGLAPDPALTMVSNS